MAKQNRPRPVARLNAAVRRAFLTHLAETSNVSASARIAGVDRDAFYAERRRSPAFCAEWLAALAEGYARLETDMLAEALQPANGCTSDATLKARAQKHKLRLSLLALHAKNISAPVPSAGAVKADLGVLKAQLLLKLTQMRDRAGIPLDGADNAGKLP